jgi:hypothetical protein
MRRRDAVLAATVSIALCFGATACGGNDEPAAKRTAAKDQCGGVLSPAALTALEQVMGKQFSDAADATADETVEQLRSDYGKRLNWSRGKQFCEISKTDGGVNSMTVSFSLYAPDDLSGSNHAANLHAYPMGKEALAGAEDAYLYFECVSPELEGSKSRPARVAGHLSQSEPPSDTEEVHKANMAVLHSAAVAVAGELKCEGNAGLPADPKLTPAD